MCHPGPSNWFCKKTKFNLQNQSKEGAKKTAVDAFGCVRMRPNAFYANYNYNYNYNYSYNYNYNYNYSYNYNYNYSYNYNYNPTTVTNQKQYQLHNNGRLFADKTMHKYIFYFFFINSNL